MLFHAELTDTFAGEANYCWLKRATFQAPCDASSQMLIRRARRALRVSYSFRTVRDDQTILRADAVGSCIALFVFPANI